MHNTWQVAVGLVRRAGVGVGTRLRGRTRLRRQRVIARWRRCTGHGRRIGGWIVSSRCVWRRGVCCCRRCAIGMRHRRRAAICRLRRSWSTVSRVGHVRCWRLGVANKENITKKKGGGGHAQPGAIYELTTFHLRVAGRGRRRMCSGGVAVTGCAGIVTA